MIKRRPRSYMSYTLAGDAEGHVECDMWKPIKNKSDITFVLRAAGFDVRSNMTIAEAMSAIGAGPTLSADEVQADISAEVKIVQISENADDPASVE